MNPASRTLIVTALAGLFLAGCAQNVGDINRVQPNYWKKSDFQGEWYIRQTIADVPPSVAFSFVGDTLQMEKIRWEITEDYLVAYRSYERIPGMNPEVDDQNKTIDHTDIPRDADGNPIWDEGYYNKNGYKDAPIAAYPIRSHFDIQRQYNPATGEQTNVIVENTSDRPWYEREFMRVDWSQNQITNYTGDRTHGMSFDGAEYIQESEGGAYAFRMEDADGNPVVNDPTDPEWSQRKPPAYFDFTARLYVPAPVYRVSEDYAVPACWLIGSTYDCTGGEVKVRTSVLKVPEKRTYAPKVYDDNDMLRFGYFRTERVTYDRRRGTTNEGQIFLANMHNIWETDYDADGNLLPYAQRKPKPIVYALSYNWPVEMRAAAEWVARGWSEALTRAVAAAQGRPFEQVKAEFPYEDEKGNYVNEGLFRLDYNEDRHARIGDLRYNFMYWVDQPQVSSPLGYGPSSVDPETGEIIAAQAYVYGAPLDTYAQFALDVVDALNGDLTIDDMVSGDYVRDHIIQNRDRTDPRKRVAALGLDGVFDKPILPDGRSLLRPEQIAKIEAIRQFGLEPLKETTAQRLQRIQGTPFESYLINDEIRAVIAQRQKNVDVASRPVDQELLDAARSITLGGRQALEMDKVRERWASMNNVWLANFDDPSILGLAQDLAQSGMDREQMYQFLRGSILRAVTEHEVGHTLGLRHNFQGSYDAFNFFPEYWDLRKENLDTNPQTIGDLLAMSELTDNQVAGKMREYQYSSIMDYGRLFNSDIHGLGAYDRAAILYAYADSVEVFREVGSSFRSNFMDTTFEHRGSMAYSQWLDQIHYTWIPILLGDGDVDLGIQRLYDRVILPKQMVDDERAAGKSDRFLEVPYMFCSDEWVGVDASCQRWDEGADMWEQARNVMESWRSYYWFNNFRRDRYDWSPYDTYRRSAGRYFNVLPNLYQTWLFDQFSSQPDSLQATYKTIGAFEGFNFLIEVLSMPAYGSYDFNAADNAYEYAWSYGHRSGEALYLDRGNDARRVYTRYDYDRGYYYWYYPQEAGHFWDYYAALQALSQSQAVVKGVDVQSDFSTYLIPYYLVFDKELNRVFNGITTETYRDFAPRYTTVAGGAHAVVQRPAYDWAGLYPEGSDFIDNDPIVRPEINFTSRFYALLFGMASFTSSYSLDYPDSHRIFRLGSGETLDPGEGFDVVTFDDPTTGIVYAALQPRNQELTAAARMIQEANRYRQELEDLQTQRDQCTDDTCRSDLDTKIRRKGYDISNAVEWMNIERGLYDVFGRNI